MNNKKEENVSIYLKIVKASFCNKSWVKSKVKIKSINKLEQNDKENMNYRMWPKQYAKENPEL